MKNTTTILILIIASFFIANSGFTQQESLFTQFWNTKNYFNPATAGLNYTHQANLMARWQWIGVNGAPDTQLASYSMKSDKIHGGIGMNYLHEKIGNSEINKVKMNYAYHLTLKNEGILSFGLTAGMNHFSSNPIWIKPTPSTDTIFLSAFSDTKFTSDLGIAYSNKRLNVGASITQLNEARYSGDSHSYQEMRHYYLFADYTFGKEEGFQFIPQILYKTAGGFQQIDINAIIKYKNRYSIGATYRTRDSFSAMIAWDIKSIYRISYSYDRTISKLNNGINGGSHEIHLGLRLK